MRLSNPSDLPRAAGSSACRCAAWLRRPGVLPALIFGVALLPRLIGLGRQPFWLDEVFTMQRASLAPRALVHDSLINHHLPSFFLLLAPLVGLGDPQFWLRLPSAAFGAVSVTMVYLIAERLAGRLAGAFAALILCLSPTALAFAQEARSYTLEMTLILIGLFGIASLAMDIPAASLRWSDKDAARGAWAAFVLGSAAALDVLGDAMPWILTANLIGLVMLWKSPDRHGLLRNLIIADLLLACMSAPLYLLMVMTVKNGFVHSFDWIPPLTGPRIWYNIASIYLMRVADWVTFRLMAVPTPAALMWLIDGGLLAAVMLGAWRLRHRPGPLAAVGLSFLTLPVVTILVSIWKPMLLPRYILWSSAPFAILAGIGASLAVSRLAWRGRAMAFGLSAAALLLNLLPYYDVETKPRWDIAARILASEVAPGDVVYLNDGGALPILRMYLPPSAAPVVLNDSGGDLRHAEEAQLQGKRIWVVFGHAGQSASKREWPQFYQHIAPLGTPVRIQMAGNRIYITEFDATSHGVTEDCVTPLPAQEGAVAQAMIPNPPPCG